MPDQTPAALDALDALTRAEQTASCRTHLTDAEVAALTRRAENFRWERDTAHAELDQWRATYGENALRDAQRIIAQRDDARRLADSLRDVVERADRAFARYDTRPEQPTPSLGSPADRPALDIAIRDQIAADALRWAADRIDPGPRASRPYPLNEQHDVMMATHHGTATNLRFWADQVLRGYIEPRPAGSTPPPLGSPADRAQEPATVRALRTGLDHAITYLTATHRHHGLHDGRTPCEGCEVLGDLEQMAAAVRRDGSPHRAQGDGTLTRCCVHPGCPRTYRADVGPQDRGWIRLRGLTVLCPDHAQDAAPPATIAVEPPTHPTEGHREDDTIPEAHTAAEGCDDCSVEPGERHRHAGCPGNQRPAEGILGPGEGVGRCGDVAPTWALRADSPQPTCALPHGHAGWHRADDGCEWAEQAEDDEWDALDKAFRPVLEQAFDAMAAERAEG